MRNDEKLFALLYKKCETKPIVLTKITLNDLIHMNIQYKWTTYAVHFYLKMNVKMFSRHLTIFNEPVCALRSKLIENQ